MTKDKTNIEEIIELAYVNADSLVWLQTKAKDQMLAEKEQYLDEFGKWFDGGSGQFSHITKAFKKEQREHE